MDQSNRITHLPICPWVTMRSPPGQGEKTLPEKNNPIWALLKGFGQKLDKQEDEGHCEARNV